MNLKELNTLGIEAEAKDYFVIDNKEDLLEIIKNLKEFIILGGGSNLCFAEEAISKPVIKINIKGVEKVGEVLVAGAGEDWDSFVKTAMDFDVPNIENLSGIPGTVGASPIQNIGAYGVEVKDIIEWVEFFNPDKGDFESFSNEECQFSYRDSIFKRRDYIITRVAFRIKKSVPYLEYKDLKEYFQGVIPCKKEVRQAVLEIRSKKFPSLEEFGTAGSFFKNPIVSIKKYEELKKEYPEIPCYDFSREEKKIPLAWVLDNVCNLKGYKEGNVWLHDKQPLVLVTNKKATAEEIKNFSEKIKKIVYDKIKIKIQNEVVFKK